MAVRHVTLYECDRCKALVAVADLTSVKISGFNPTTTDLCGRCLMRVRAALLPPIKVSEDLDHE